MTDRDGRRGWDEGWTGHERAQLVRLSRLSLREKILWLEEAQRVAQALERSRTLAAGGGSAEGDER
jgi:hypothetical protein